MKLFNKFVSIVTVVAFVLSMMAVPAFAAGVEDFPTATGDEKLVVTYYSDAACENAITKAEPGATVYAKVSASIPTATFRSLDVDLAVANATIEGETDKFSPVMGATTFLREQVDGSGLNEIKADKTGANIYIGLGDGTDYDSPTNNFNTETNEFTNIVITSFDITSYELKITGEAGSTIAFSDVSDPILRTGLNIGVFDEGPWETVSSPFTVEGTLAIESAAQEPVITYSYDATIASTKVDPESATYEDDVKALVTVTKTTLSDGTATGTETVAAKAIVVDKAAKTVTVTLPDDTTKVLSYTEMVIEYGTPAVDLEYPLYDYAVTEDDIAEDVSVTVLKTKDGAVEKLTLVAGTDYDVVVTFDENANSGKAVVTFKGAYAGNTAVTKTFGRTDAPVSYKDVVASISGSPFAFGTTEDEIKAAIAVKGTKVEGVVETADVTVPAGLYEITVDLAAGTAVVTMDAETIATLTFEISEETFTYSDYAVVYTGEDEYDYTVDANTIAALVKVTATKTGETTPAETVDLTNEVDVVVDKDAGTITVTWKAGSAHAAETIDGAVRNVTFNDVITYANATATMSKTSFAEDALDDEIEDCVDASLDMLVNGVEDDSFVPDWYVTVDRLNNKVIVEFDDEYGIEDIEIAITFYSSDAVVLKVVGGEGVTAGEVEESDGEFKAIVKVEGLDTRVLYDAVLSISASAGVLEEVAVVTGSGYNVLDGSIAGNVWTGTIYKGIEAVDLANGLLVVTVNTDGLADGTVIEVKVDSATLRMVEGLDFVAIDNTTEALEVEVNAFVRNVEDVTLNDVEIDIVTLGPVTDAKFVDGVSLTAADGTEIDLTGKVTLNGTNRSIVIDDVALAVSDTENVVKYTLKVEVAGYTTIESEIVVSYNGVDTNDWTVTDTLADAKIYAADVTGDDNTIAADDYSDVVAMYNQTAAFDIYEGNGININDISTTVYMYDNYGMKLVDKTTGVIAAN